VSVCVTVVMMDEVATGTSVAHTTAAKNNIQGKARSRKVRRIARAITSNIEGGKPRSCTPEQATARKKKDIDLSKDVTCLYRVAVCQVLANRTSIRARRYHYSCHQCYSSPWYMLVMMMKLFEFPVLLMFRLLLTYLLAVLVILGCTDNVQSSGNRIFC
jgi:hypothetical protein